MESGYHGLRVAWLVAVPACALAVACASRPPEPAARPYVAPNPWADLTRDLLAQQCGRCHRGDLPEAPPRALAVFNLLEEPWYGRLQPDQFDGILTRLRATGALDPGDESAVVRFVECARDGRCDPGPAEHR